MKMLTVRIESLDDIASSVRTALEDGPAEKHAVLSFLTYEDMNRILSPRRLELIRTMSGQGSLTFREVARRMAPIIRGYTPICLR